MGGETTVECDLLVVGSGAGGLATAVTARWLGLDVIVAEKAPLLGGTTAWSGGWMWIPRNPLAIAAGIIESADEPRRYLRHELANHYDAARVDMYLDAGPRMVDFFTSKTALQFIAGNTIPDFHGNSPGAALGGRSVCAAPFDGRELGARLQDLRPPLAETAPFGMAIASGADLKHFLAATYDVPSFRHVAGRIARHGVDLVRHGRGMHLVNGNALVARLLKSADDLGVRIWTSAAVQQLARGSAGAVIGATIERDGVMIKVAARRGVVLAAGGFPHDRVRKAQLFAHDPSGTEHWSAAPPSNSGDGLRLGEAVGGDVRRDLTEPGAWAPVSLVPRSDGTVGHFPHLIERGKPGLIAVRRDGRRFANEADPYHDVMKALFAATPVGEAPAAWLICDHAFIRRYGLGAVRPRPFPLTPWLRNRYVLRGADPADLARQCGIAEGAFAETIAAFNRDASNGQDTAFGRGGTPYNRIQGEATHGPNPCVRALDHPPYYGVKIVPGSLGTFAGLRTDVHARVLDRDAQPISGLYAVGNDMASMMGGNYPSGGITLGPAMTFGYIAAHHANGTPVEHSNEPGPTGVRSLGK